MPHDFDSTASIRKWMKELVIFFAKLSSKKDKYLITLFNKSLKGYYLNIHHIGIKIHFRRTLPIVP